MISKRWIELFEGDNNRLSMARLTMFLSFFPASYVIMTTKTEGTLGWYIGGYVLGYVGGKGMDALNNGVSNANSNKRTIK
jgi:hypothetical protein